MQSLLLVKVQALITCTLIQKIKPVKVILLF